MRFTRRPTPLTPTSLRPRRWSCCGRTARGRRTSAPCARSTCPSTASRRACATAAERAPLARTGQHHTLQRPRTARTPTHCTATQIVAPPCSRRARYLEHTPVIAHTPTQPPAHEILRSRVRLEHIRDKRCQQRSWAQLRIVLSGRLRSLRRHSIYHMKLRLRCTRLQAALRPVAVNRHRHIFLAHLRARKIVTLASPAYRQSLINICIISSAAWGLHQTRPA